MILSRSRVIIRAFKKKVIIRLLSGGSCVFVANLEEFRAHNENLFTVRSSKDIPGDSTQPLRDRVVGTLFSLSVFVCFLVFFVISVSRQRRHGGGDRCLFQRRRGASGGAFRRVWLSRFHEAMYSYYIFNHV